MPLLGMVPFVGGTGIELLTGGMTDDDGIVEEAEALMDHEDDDTPVPIGPATLELIPVPIGRELTPVPAGAVLAGQKSLSQAVY